jgi:hypothetical protein
MATTDPFLADGVTPNPDYVPTADNTFVPSPATGIDQETQAETFDVTTPEPTPGVLGGFGAEPVPESSFAPTVSQLQTDLGAGETSKYITPEATVAGQLDTLLSTDSPYMQVAEAKAKEAANLKGMLSTSMAIGAGHRAAIESALPIAQQDAKAFEQSDLALQAQAGESALRTQAFEEEYAINIQKAYENLRALTHQGEINFTMEKMGQAAEDRRLEYESNIKAWSETAKISSTERQNFLDQVENRGSQYSADLASVLRDPNFETPEDQQNARELLFKAYQDDIDFMAAATGANMSWDGVPTTPTDLNTGIVVDPVDPTVDPTDPAVVTPPPGTTAQDTLNGPSIDISGATPGFTLDGGTSLADAVLTDQEVADKQALQISSSGEYYAPLTLKSYSNYDAFAADLESTGMKDSDEYWAFTTQHPEILGPLGFQVTPEELDTMYTKAMYAYLNPENPAATQEMNTAFTYRRLTDSSEPGAYVASGAYFVDDSNLSNFQTPPGSLPPSEMEALSNFQKWLNSL